MSKIEPLFTHNLGFPRIGKNRELKKATENFWNRNQSLEELEATAKSIRKDNWLTQLKAGINLIPSNDFSFYDQVLDMSCLLGNVPPRFNWNTDLVSLPLLFQIARDSGSNNHSCSDKEKIMFASEMTKWFDTNYHYLVPEFYSDISFHLSSEKPFKEFSEALELGIKTKPILIGPLTYLYLGKSKEQLLDPLTLLDSLLPVYAEILSRFATLGVEWIQFDEPILNFDLSNSWKQAFQRSYHFLRSHAQDIKFLLATYFGEIRDNISTVCSLEIDTLHIDAIKGINELDIIVDALPNHFELSLGLVDGRNIWKNDFLISSQLIDKVSQKIGRNRLWIAPSCSLIHVPLTLKSEIKINSEIKDWLSFAEEKLNEVLFLSRWSSQHAVEDEKKIFFSNQQSLLSKKTSTKIHRKHVTERVLLIEEKDAQRSSPFHIRKKIQQQKLKLPLYPTTTVGSFPQTTDIRHQRSQWKKGSITHDQYINFLRQKIAECIKIQEDIGLDCLVHGEFERSDMVEFFGEYLDGFTFTENAWIQSYGSRYVKPPIIFGDISRLNPITVEWASYAQSLTKKFIKGMLTGPITILQWSFVRNDIPRAEVAKQIALAIRDEVLDLEKAGISVIQIDEPALREGLPLRKDDWKEYLYWSTFAFRLVAGGVSDETQIHTHMCYCEFNDIIDSIASLDADVISIEASRSNMEILEAFSQFHYPNDVGPGIWDIHSPRIPSAEEIEKLLLRAMSVLPHENIWVNPDCGLKTREWSEVVSSLKNMVAVAQKIRKNS